MKKIPLIFVLCGLFNSQTSVAASCSQANLTRCLDSVCAINVSSNPAARCQYCGTSSAGTPPTKTGLKSLSIGQSAKYTLSEKELEDAPTDPGKRYEWATKECIKKIEGCTPEDVSDTYDKLIEQSCKAAGISSKMTESLASSKKTVNESSCSSDINTCIVNEKRCGSDFAACEDDENFNKFFSECSVEATGCDSYLSAIRNDLIASRDAAIKNADTLLQNIVTAYQSAREKKLSDAQTSCKDNKAREDCVETVCERNMPNKCAIGYETEKSAAIQMCKFYELACDRLK